MKICTSCQRELDTTEFAQDKRTRDGLAKICRDCGSAPEADAVKVPPAPSGLKARGRALWTELHQTFTWGGDPQRHLLVEDICREADLIDRLQRAVDAQGLRVVGSQGQPTAAPEVSELRMHRALLGQLVARLSLPDAEEDKEPVIPQSSKVQRKATLKVVK
ncbi:hypothetical protein AXA44_40595 [Rhodococcus sp. SC4]|nr:hypothetical protein AXA44_40595 [Rhodococcus sp. SC4]